MAERCTVEGAVQSLIFQNEDNGYTVLSLLTEDGELVTVVGCIPCAAPGEGMTVTGVWTNHPSYGPQFAAESVERRMPRTEEEIVSYLSSGILKGIGPATAQRLADRFGADTLAVIEEEPERLQTVKGITARRAMELSAAFRELTGLKRVMEFLARYELPVPLAMQLYRAYGADALPRLREDPYLLTGRRLWRGFFHHGRDCPEHGLRRRQPLPGGGRSYIRIIPQPEQRPCVPAPGQAAVRRRPAHQRGYRRPGDGPGRSADPGRHRSGAGGGGAGPAISSACIRRRHRWPGGCCPCGTRPGRPGKMWTKSSPRWRPARASPMRPSSAGRWSWRPGAGCCC